MDAEGKIAVVTGAGSGIGRASALALAKTGWTVIAAGRRMEALQETVGLNAPSAGPITAITCDVRDPASVTALFAAAKEAYGRLDLLFNNAWNRRRPRSRLRIFRSITGDG